MFFCQRCSNFSSTDRCDFCGAKKLRQARENDPIYLSTQNFIYAGMLEEALKQNGIPCIKREKHGGFLKFAGLGLGTEEFSFYVPLGEIDRAKEILGQLFCPIVLRLKKNPPLFKTNTRNKKRSGDL